MRTLCELNQRFFISHSRLSVVVSFKLLCCEDSMPQHHGRWIFGLAISAVLGTAGSSQAQELRRDTVSNGVLIGAGTGTAAGMLLGLATEEVCSPGACGYLGGLTGGVIGLLVDRKLGPPRPVESGAYVDDGLRNGALAGALSGVGMALVEASIRCRKRPDRPPCTRKGILINMLRFAQWMAIAAIVIDAAIPSRLPRVEGAVPEEARNGARKRSNRRHSVSLTVRF